MRISGFGGEVLKRAGGTPVVLPGGKLFVSLPTRYHRCHRVGRTLE